MFVGYGDYHRSPDQAVLALTISCEKRPEPSSPTRLALFSLATLLALSSSEEEVTVVAMLKVLATIFFLPYLLLPPILARDPKTGSAGLRR